MAEWQNLKNYIPTDRTKLGIPKILAVDKLPEVNKYIEFDYCNRIREGHKDIGVHFFEYDVKFERCWTAPNRYAEMLQKFGCVIGPDFSVYDNFPYPIRLYNFYRNAWLTRYWQEVYNITVVPLVMWGDEASWDWCFDCYPKNSVVAVSNVGSQKLVSERDYFLNGYNEMLKRITPTKVLLFTRSKKQFDGNVRYIFMDAFKGDQLDG